MEQSHKLPLSYLPPEISRCLPSFLRNRKCLFVWKDLSMTEESVVVQVPDEVYTELQSKPAAYELEGCPFEDFSGVREETSSLRWRSCFSDRGNPVGAALRKRLLNRERETMYQGEEDTPEEGWEGRWDYFMAGLSFGDREEEEEEDLLPATADAGEEREVLDTLLFGEEEEYEGEDELSEEDPAPEDLPLSEEDLLFAGKAKMSFPVWFLPYLQKRNNPKTMLLEYTHGVSFRVVRKGGKWTLRIS